VHDCAARVAFGSAELDDSQMAAEASLNPEIRERLIRIVCERLDVAPDTLSDATSFIEDLEADSLDLADLALTIEEQFSVRIPTEDVSQMLTIGAAARYLARRLAEGAAAS